MTTLRVYAAWLAEADQRASVSLAARAPARSSEPASNAERALRRPRTPRDLLAVELRQQILDGIYADDDHLPGVKALGVERGLSPSTVLRAYELLREWGFLIGAEGERPRVRLAVSAEPAPASGAEQRSGEEMCRLVIKRRGDVVVRLMAEVDPNDPRALRGVLLGALRRRGEDEEALGEYEMIVLDAKGAEVGTFVVGSR